MVGLNDMLNKPCSTCNLVNMKYKDVDSMTIHISLSQNIVNQLTITSIKVNNELQVLLLLSSLLDIWEIFAVTLANSTPNEKLVMSTDTDNILYEEARSQKKMWIYVLVYLTISWFWWCQLMKQ